MSILFLLSARKFFIMFSMARVFVRSVANEKMKAKSKKLLCIVSSLVLWREIIT